MPSHTPLEELVAEIWRDLLKVEHIGVHDNFFDLGGHSLLLTQVVSQMRATMGIELPLSEMFSYPTVAELVNKIELVRWSSQEYSENEPDEDEVFIL